MKTNKRKINIFKERQTLKKKVTKKEKKKKTEKWKPGGKVQSTRKREIRKEKNEIGEQEAEEEEMIDFKKEVGGKDRRRRE